MLSGYRLICEYMDIPLTVESSLLFLLAFSDIGNTTVGFVIVSVSTEPGNDLAKLRSDILGAVLETIRDKQLGAYAVLDNSLTIDEASYSK